MEHDFWHERWQRRQIGFHQTTVNPWLERFWPSLQAGPGTVFVPLCGKSRDMVWLREQGHAVVGVELSEIALREFYAELGLIPQQTDCGPLSCFEADGYRLYCGDFFALTSQLLGPLAAVYDRAALIALPPELRMRYAARMAELAPAGLSTLLVAFEYPQHEMEGPPFSVPQDEVAALYAATHDIRLLHEADIIAQEPRFRDKGMSRLDEKVYCLTRR